MALVSETTLLAANYVTGKLVLYNLERQEVIWSYELLENARCITRDPSTGLIFVFGVGSKVIYVINEQGEQCHCELLAVFLTEVFSNIASALKFGSNILDPNGTLQDFCE